MEKHLYKSKTGTEAQHDSDGTKHSAAVKALHVLLCEEDGQWLAQGIEIDYAASGADLEEAKKNFADGLVLTVNEHLLMHGKLDQLLEPAPKDVLAAYIKTSPAEIKELSFLTTVQAFEGAKVERPKEKAIEFPFDAIQFSERIPAAA